jgi:hypothetical protein
MEKEVTPASDRHEAMDDVLTRLAELRTRLALAPSQIAVAVLLAMPEPFLSREGERRE